MLDFIEWDNPMLYAIWGVGVLILGYMLKTLTSRPEAFSTFQLVTMGIIGTPLLLIVAQLFLSKGYRSS